MWLLIKIIHHMIKFKGAIAKLEEAAARAHDRPARLDQLRSACHHLTGVDSHLSRMHDFLESDLPGDDRLGIWGRRGAGKTSLLTPLHQPRPYHALFDRVLYLALGGSSSVADVRRCIGICLGYYSHGELTPADERALARLIRRDLSRRSFLLLLDGLGAPVDLAAAGVPVPLGKSGRRQKVVVASETPDVCALMGCAADNVVEIGRLGEDDASGLFRDCVGDKILQNSRIRPLAKEMAEACGGLPLALRMFGCPMSAIEHADEWSFLHHFNVMTISDGEPMRERR
ncbi:hypothetical protein CFC21_093782 [Triticum aestivum]|uniref:NB-ARC domain-containing protein n=2 Tax=Triticum aestivum TaxID=4565 RepID=A0A9R1MVN4_WHEAT|nr:hypothetical protein CFC21_093782 [Triticum aestivum]